MLPFFFLHYDQIVDQYFIADHGSTDQSLAILNRHPKVALREFECNDASFVESARAHYDHCWKESRGVADWVIVCNIDEHIYHPRLLGYLQASSARGITIIHPLGFDMVSTSFPLPSIALNHQVRLGMRSPAFDKPQIFDPNQIREINFKIGRHLASPEGRLGEDRSGRVKLFHYKYMGQAYFRQRSAQLSTRMKPLDVENRWAHYHQKQDPETSRQLVDGAMKKAVAVYSPLLPLWLALQVLRDPSRRKALPAKIMEKVATRFLSGRLR
ncbi:MAG: glycosyltransferase family 2 protein [Cyanobium sp.]